ncbi:hypothetical protein [Streptacidiphilus cavernicola]|uniref:Tetratricopeptide repeat protein n=1 Tax=Streptacidiphilus cavernicola TaxID=3342716 RepID=A0ABV6V1C9_9ACTN
MTAYQAADHLYRRISDQHHRAMALLQLAACLRTAGRHDEAATAHRRAEILAHVSGNGLVEALARGAMSLDEDTQDGGAEGPGKARGGPR